MNDGAYNIKFQNNSKNVKVPKALIVVFVIVALVAVVLFNSWYTVDDKQQAVVTTFGKVTTVNEAGMHFKIPFIQQVYKVDVNVSQKIEIGYRSDGSTSTIVESESKMITGDYNIVNIDFFVEYKISDPVKYLFNSYEPDAIIANLVQSQIRNVIGSSDVDKVLTTGKGEIQAQVKELVSNELDSYDIGLMLLDVKIQDSEPPTVAVIEAFKAVETAKQIAETVINQAKAYQNSELPKAQAEADKLIQNAEYLKQNRVNDAVKQIAMFEAMYSEYSKNPELTKVRMYYEMIKEALPGVKLYIDASNGTTEKLLPLEDFANVTK